VLAGVPSSDLGAIGQDLQSLSFRPGIPLRCGDAPSDSIYFPHEGLVSLMWMTPTGETIEIASAGRSGAICPVCRSDIRDGFLMAAGPSAVRATRISSARCEAIQRGNEAFGRTLRACREALLIQLRQNLVCNGCHSAEHRLARWLLEMADRMESEIIPATQENVAQRLALRRTTVTLLASALQKSEAIRWMRSRVEILDRARLEAAACSCYSTLRERIKPLLPRIAPLADSEGQV
jgi:hypothetical protein